MTQKTKETAVPAATLTTKVGMVNFNGLPGAEIVQMLLRTVSTDVAVEDEIESDSFQNVAGGAQDFSTVINLNVEDMVVLGGYTGLLADLKIKNLVEYLALGVLFEMGREDPADWS